MIAYNTIVIVVSEVYPELLTIGKPRGMYKSICVLGIAGSTTRLLAVPYPVVKVEVVTHVGVATLAETVVEE